MIVGIVTGTYSSVFIASAIAIIWQGRSRSAGALSKASAEPAAGKARKPTRRRAS
jgi:preprotein translocase subunit SecF